MLLTRIQRRNLELYDRYRSSPPSMSKLFIRALPRYLLMLLLVIIGGLLFNYAEVTAGIYVLVGLFIGAMLRDIGWLRRFVKTWPSTAAVLDWDILETLLEEESSPEEPEIMKEVRD